MVTGYGRTNLGNTEKMSISVMKFLVEWGTRSFQKEWLSKGENLKFKLKRGPLNSWEVEAESSLKFEHCWAFVTQNKRLSAWSMKYFTPCTRFWMRIKLFGLLTRALSIIHTSEVSLEVTMIMISLLSFDLVTSTKNSAFFSSKSKISFLLSVPILWQNTWYGRRKSSGFWMKL